MKKKKVILSILAFLCCAGTVQAASLHGDYNAAPIVKVLFGGKELQAEDVPATIQDGRTVVPLYLLKQTGASVTWDAEKYTVDLEFPPAVNADSAKEFAAGIPALNEKAKAYKAQNVRLIYNEYGPYLNVDLEESNDSNVNNEHIIALSRFVLNAPADLLVVNIIRNSQVINFITIKRTDAEAFSQNKLTEFEFIRCWKAQYINMGSTAELSPPNKPEVAPSTPDVPLSSGGAHCSEIMMLYNAQIQREVEQYNAKIPSNSSGFEKHIEQLKESMRTALKNNGCPEN